jgi:putative transposase
MEAVYSFVGQSRQAFWQKMESSRKFQALSRQIVAEVEALRCVHPRMGARKIYLKWCADTEMQSFVSGIGRDKFEAILLDNGLRLGKMVFGHRTTFSGAMRFRNRIAGQSFNGINQVWTSDITYYWIEGEWVYITLILDIYSRLCLSAVLSRRLLTEDTTLPALKQALDMRCGTTLDGLILHSDGGGQYYDKNFVKKTGDSGIINSMGVSCYENPFSERLNGILKNEYLIPKKPLTYDSLKKELITTLFLYNTDRPHLSINNLTPKMYEKLLESIPIEQRIPLVINVLER